MKTNIRSIILVVSGITFLTAMEWILSDLLHAIIYGISYTIILGSYIYQEDTQIKIKKKLILHFVGMVLLCVNNVFVFSNLSGAILLSLSFLISLSGTYLLRFLRNSPKEDD